MSSHPLQRLPLHGVRVLDLTNVLSGPYCCHLLAHMGAEVIKVESRKGGDLARQLGADTALNKRDMGISFLAQNAGKRSITVDLKTPGGKAVLRRLVASAQVLVENFRPGVMTRLGVGYEQLLAENPTLIYCAISGFGQDGPLRDLPAYDQIIQGMSGVMSITGDSASAPLRVGYPMADTVGGVTAAFAVAAALADRQRTQGSFIDVSMLDATLSTMGWAVSNFLMADRTPLPMGNDNVTASPSGTFRTGDGLLNIAANKQEQFEALCEVVGRNEWRTDPRFADRHARLQHRAELSAALDEALGSRSATDWWPLLSAAGVPSGPVHSVPQALAQPQVAGRDFTSTYPDVPGVGRDVRIARPGFRLDGERPAVATPPPQLGQHTQDILGELGYSRAEIETLMKEQAV